MSFLVILHFYLLRAIELPRGDDMGYQVVYEPASKRKQAGHSGKSLVPGMTAACFLFFLLLVNCFFPRGREVLRQVVWPGDREAALQAAEVFIQELRYGENIDDAVESFCREILGDGDLNG